MDKEAKYRNLQSISLEERRRLENEIRSNLRYSWQKTASYILYYNPTIYEIEEELKRSFLQFIPITFPKRKKIELILTDSFIQILESLLDSNKITSVEIEDKFIESAIDKLKDLLI